jgi:hypothetical protein
VVREKDKTLGEQLVVLGTIEERLTKGAKGVYKGYGLDSSADYLIKQLDQHAYCSRGHVAGATPDNNYALPDSNRLTVEFRQQQKYVGKVEDGDYKVFVKTSGADSARPMRMKRNEKGIWKTAEWSSFAVGCKKPKEAGPAPSDEL